MRVSAVWAGNQGDHGTIGPPEARIDPNPIDSWWLVDGVVSSPDSWWLADLDVVGDSGSWWLTGLVGEAEVPVGSLPGSGSALGGRRGPKIV